MVKADPDGYTLLVSGSTSYTVNAALRPKLPYDPLKDLAPVAIVAKAPLVIVVNANAPYKDLNALLSAAKRPPPRPSTTPPSALARLPTWWAHCWSKPRECACKMCPTAAAPKP